MTAPAEQTTLAAPTVFFDGDCALCNRSVAFLARRDAAGRLHFAHLQGATARRVLDAGLRDCGRDASVVLVEPGGRISLRSAAVLRALAQTSRRRRWLAALAERPFALRLLDRVYGVVARHREGWFGRSQQCPLPDPGLRSRFLDGLPAAAPPERPPARPQAEAQSDAAR